MSNDVKLEPEAIWLSPRCDAEAPHGEGRLWANPAPEAACDDCGLPWVKYVRADLASHQPQREAVLEDCDIAWLWKVHADAQSKGLHADQRKIERILAALTTPAPAVSTDEIVAVLEALPVRREVHNLGTELQRYGRETVVLPIELRDAILSRLRGEG